MARGGGGGPIAAYSCRLMDLSGVITAQMLVSAVTVFVVLHLILIVVAYLIYVERKVSAYIQDRIGPNRVGFDFGLPFLSKLKGVWGLGQPLADGIKFLLKEDYRPTRADKWLFTLAPVAIIIPALIGFVILPWGGMLEVPDLTLPIIGEIEGGLVHVAGAHVNVGVVYLLAVASVGVYGVTLGGWASNNKYSFFGGLRATAQMISYEIPLGLSLLAVLLLVGSFLPTEIIGYQIDNGWLILSQPIACFIFYIAILAEANRVPFDNAEAEQELVGGYHTEYSSMRFALFFLAEYAHIITSSAFLVLLFLGGYHLPGTPWLQPEATGIGAVLAKFAVFFGKVVLLIVFTVVVRWTIPRLRYDQVMTLAWQAVIPTSLAIVLMTSILVYMQLSATIWMLLANIALVGLIMLILPRVPGYAPNRKLPLYGSRFNPVEGEQVLTAPTLPLAREDRPEHSGTGTGVN